ncbi:MAG: hypothetical protein ACX93P_08700 [Roseovarius sp.]
MLLCRPRYLFVLAIVAAIALSSAVSAARMAPDNAKIAVAGMALLYGTPSVSVCGTTSSDEHRCQFCHLLSDAPQLAPEPLVWILRPHDGWRQLSGLARSAKARNINHSVRAPPEQA